ncbi:MAG: hypothetical protein ACXW1Z_23700 [Methylobacter sp.]
MQDGPRYQVREERNGKGKAAQIEVVDMAFVTVDQICNDLKGEKRDPQRQDQMQQGLPASRYAFQLSMKKSAYLK